MVKALLILNGLAAVGVVVHHAAFLGFTAVLECIESAGPSGNTAYERMGAVNWAILLLEQLDRFTLPGFIFVSGFFVAFTFGSGTAPSWKAVIPRITHLAIPVLFWNVVHFSLLQRWPTSPFEPIGTYYYVTLVIVYYLLSPLLVLAAKKRPTLVLALAAVPEVGWAALGVLDIFVMDVGRTARTIHFYLKPRDWLPPNLLFWFALGVVATIHRRTFAEWLACVRPYLPIGVVVSGTVVVAEYALLAHVSSRGWLGHAPPLLSGIPYALMVIGAVLAFSGAFGPVARPLSNLGSKSLGIYLANMPAMYVAALSMNRWTPDLRRNQLVYQAVLMAAGLGIPLLLMEVVSRSRARVVYRYLFG